MTVDYDPQFPEEHLESILSRVQALQGDNFIVAKSMEMEDQEHNNSISLLAESCVRHAPSDSPEQNEQRRSLNYAAFTLGYALYGECLPKDQATDFWERIDEISHVLMRLSESYETGTRHPSDRVGDHFVRNLWDQACRHAQVVASEDSVERTIIDEVGMHYSETAHDTRLFQFSVGLMKELSLRARGELMQVTGTHLGSSEVHSATLSAFFDNEHAKEFLENPSADKVPDVLNQIILDMNNDAVLDTIYKQGAPIIAREGGVILIVDSKNGTSKFHKLSQGWRAQGLFVRFQTADIPAQKVFDALSTPVDIESIEAKNKHEFGLYARLADGMLFDKDGEGLALSDTQRIFIPLNYAGQPIYTAC